MRFLIAILITILIHLILIIEFKKEKYKELTPKPKNKKTPINISNFKIKKPPTPKIEPKPIIKKVLKKKTIKKKSSKKIVKQKRKPILKPKVIKKEENLSKKIYEAMKKKKIDILEKKVKKRDLQKEQNLLNFLKTPTRHKSKERVKLKQKPLKELYKDEFEYLSKEEIEYLEDNLAMIGYITQKHLRYPRIAGMTGQEGVNIVEFYLFSNGDISDIKIIKGSNYTTLDKNTIKTIEYAYKEYPRPKHKTKIRIYTHYSIYGINF